MQHSWDNNPDTVAARRGCVRRTRPSIRLFRLASGFALLAACSFQDFSSLQDGEAGGGDGDGDGNGDGDGDATGGTSTGDGDGDGSGGIGGTGGTSTGDGDGDGDGDTSGGMGGMGGMPVSVLENGSFETSSTAGWTIDPPGAVSSRHVFVQAPTGTVPAPDGIYELAFWHDTDSYEVTISQQVSDIPDGTYTLRGYFSRGPNLMVEFFARGCSDEDPQPEEIPVTDSNSFTLFIVEDIVVEGGECEIGISVSAGPGDWMNVDHITLTRE